MAPLDDASPTPATVTNVAGDTPAGAPTRAPYVHGATSTPGPSDRYEIEGEQGRGGIGVVLRARDRHLGRLVALKQLQHDDVGSRHRFEREMMITARLQHPGVVPVHEAGRFATGEPYYAMKLIEGHSLQRLIEDAADLEVRLALVPNVLAVAEAVGYAHSRRVIHRDLKPANVIVGSYGETVVIDWGIAKVLGPDGDGETDDAATAPLATGDGLTAAGAVLGTPAYMAPEQARGDDVDERADVWALGAVLYQVLVGRPPYEGRSADVLPRVLVGEYPPLESRVSGVPADLRAIVGKAMHVDRAARYPSAKDMADDLRRFTTGQLVSARVYSRGARLRRWLGRHRVTVTVSAGLIAALVATGAISVARIVRERDRAESERALAAAHRDAAEKLVAFLVDEFRDRVRKADRLDLLGGLGEKLAAYYQRLDEAGAPVDAPSLHRRAAALETLAVVEMEKKNQAAARALYQQAIALRERAGAGASRSTAADLVRLGGDWRDIGTIENEQGNIDAALAAHDRAIALADQAVALRPADADLIGAHLLAASSLDKKAYTLHFRKGDVQAAYDAMSQARDRLAATLRDHPDDDKLLRRLASINANIHIKELHLGKLDDAAGSMEQALALYQQATRRAPDDAGLARAYAGAYFGLSGVEVARGNLREALAAMKLHLDRYEDISRQDPTNVATVRDLGWSYGEYCSLHRRALALADATLACDRAVAIFRGHVARDAGSKESQDALLSALVQRARIEAAAGKRREALATASEALAIARGLTAADPQAGRWREDVAMSLSEVATQEIALGRAAEAVPHAREVVSIIEPMAADAPTDVEAQSGLAEARMLLGDALLGSGQRADASAAYQAALAPLESIAAKSPAIVFFQVRLARACAKLAAAAARDDLRGKALAILDGLKSRGRLYPEDELVRAALVR